MPWIPMYVIEEDARVLLTWLTESTQIAFLLSDGTGRWKAVHELNELPNAPVNMWHIPSGALPLLGKERHDPVKEIAPPWNGWTEQRSGADKHLPYFGPGWPGVMTLNLQLVSRRTQGEHPSSQQAPSSIGLSNVGWIGNRYKLIGSAAKPETERFWKMLRRFVASHTTKIPRTGSLDGPDREIYAFPSALDEIRNGRARAANPE
jgi:hypothetical protein